MYSREYGGKDLRFEASGGLIDSTLVMQDKETDSYWSIMKGESVGGEFEGTELKELPVTHKIRWKDWVTLYPETLVLSVNGREDVPRNVYDSYMESDEGFRGSRAIDKRLDTKEEVYAFRLNGRAFAAPFKSLEGGKVFQVGEASIFLFRSKKSPLYQSTVAYLSDSGNFERTGETWTHRPSGATFDVRRQSFGKPVDGIERLSGFDTFWYTWSPFHPDTEILE